MRRTTIFLRQPVGVAIHTTDFDTVKQATDAVTNAMLGATGILVVESDKAKAVMIPVDNIASVEVQ